MREVKEMKIDFNDLTKTFKALGDVNRLKILAILHEALNSDCCNGEFNHETCMKYLAEQLDITMPTVSHHIKELVNVRIITTEKRGRWVSCGLNQERLDEIRNFLNGLKEKT